MLPKLPTSTGLPQSIINAISKPAKTKKVSIPKIKQSTAGKSMLKSMIKNAKAQSSGLSKTAGVKSKAPKFVSLAKVPTSKSSKVSTAIKRGLSRLG